MYEVFVAILLGVVEGLTEFLPVSSTGHLLLFEKYLGFCPSPEVPPPGMLAECAGAGAEVFTVVIQFGAILAVVAAYADKFWHVARNFHRDSGARHFVWSVLIAFIPAAIAGLLLHHYITAYLFNPTVVALMMIVGGIAILAIEHYAPKPRYTDGDHLPFGKALQIGLCQCLALIPGVSRSGATIMGGLLLGVERKAAAEFTFYLAVPTMLGASVFEIYKNWHQLSSADALIVLIGFVVSFIAAYAVVKTFIAFISRYGFAPFAWYRIAVGVLMIGLIMAP